MNERARSRAWRNDAEAPPGAVRPVSWAERAEDAADAAPGLSPATGDRSWRGGGPAPGRGRGYGANRTAQLLRLQQTDGNRAVQRVLRRGGGEGEAPGEADLGTRLRGSGAGQALQPGVQRRLEDGLSADLSGVRVHADAEADALSRAVDAEAFTTGRDVYFRAGAYAPDSTEGLLLLAHEAAHTVQQAAGPVAGTPAPGGVALSDPADAFERAAVQAAARVVSGEEAPAAEAPATAPAETDAAPVQRQEVGDQFYAHGAFMGAAPQMLQDPLWNSILQTLMPDVHADVQGVTDAATLMPMFENNPVMAAYGMLKTQELDQRQEAGRSDRIETMEAIEWDVFLDDSVVREYQNTTDETARQDIDRRVVDTMIIAHGTTPQIVKERTIGSQHGSVEGTRKTGMGGATGGAWMDLFGRALQIATASDPDELMGRMEGEARHTDEDNQSLFQTFEEQLPFDEVVALYKDVFGGDTFSVLLDIKSANVGSDVLARLVYELNRRGVHVYGVGSFVFAQLNDLDQLNQQVDGQSMGAPRTIKFFHGIGNLQAACLDSGVFKGDSVMFNAGSILDSVDWDAETPDANDEAIESMVQDLGAFKSAYGFHLGLYVQEDGTDQRAATKITDLSNQHADIFDLGFAWGGISNDMGPINDGGAGMGVQDSVFIGGTDWDEDAAPTPPTGFESTFSIRSYLESRHFKVKWGHVEVRAQATWDSEPAPADSYTVTLRQSDFAFDTTYDRHSFKVGEAGNAQWDGLGVGTYYLEIDVANQEQANLNGEIEVSY